MTGNSFVDAKRMFKGKMNLQSGKSIKKINSRLQNRARITTNRLVLFYLYIIEIINNWNNSVKYGIIQKEYQAKR